jgi:hypothetical protein
MARYSLARHVFVCRDEEAIVVLDLRADRYFQLDAPSTAPLAPLLTGWPAGSSADPVPPEAAVAEVAAALLMKGWLLEGEALGKAATPVVVATPHTELLGDIEVSPAGIDLGAVLAFGIASFRAKFAVRLWGLERVIRRVTSRKARRAGQTVDMERARQLMEVFGRLRVFLFSHREECLHDSLALLEFLARYGIFPDWVFAVRARPFVAHCWVQYQDVVFNDTAEHVGGYTPIMVV